ncbi:hypothetical protein [Kushneria sinocarnis]|uniref:hypothetical protein n=1 Tax=Kushneria sinocarnis TaxID=595502 RepID=UPI000EB16F32|nr:hypothetical protein [Kushneria sinocarnis]
MTIRSARNAIVPAAGRTAQGGIKDVLAADGVVVVRADERRFSCRPRREAGYTMLGHGAVVAGSGDGVFALKSDVTNGVVGLFYISD